MLPTGAGLTYDFKLSCHKVLPCGFHSESLRHKRQTCSIHLGRVQIKRRRTPPHTPEPFFHFTSTIKRHERVFFGPTTMTMFTLFILFMNIAHDGYWKPWTVTWSDGGMGHTSETVSTTRAPVFPKRLMADETPPPLMAKVIFLSTFFGNVSSCSCSFLCIAQPVFLSGSVLAVLFVISTTRSLTTYNLYYFFLKFCNICLKKTRRVFQAP